MSRNRLLTDEQVLAIRWAPKGFCSAFARAFGLSAMTVWRIRQGESYKHLRVAA